MLHRLLPALLLALSTPAFAQPAEDEALKQRVTTLYNQGNIAAQNNNWQAAHKAFLEAWNLKQHVQIAANLARAEFKLSLFRDAAEHLDFVLKNAPADTPPEEQKLARDMFDQARQHIGELKVEVNLEGAEVLINGSSVGYAPLKQSIFVEPGTHIVEARLDGYPSVRQSRELKAGAPVVNVSLKLEKKALPVVPLQPEVIGPNKGVMIAGWSVVGAGFIATAVSAGFSLSYSGDLDTRRKNNCNNYSDRALCESDFADTGKKWELSTNMAINAGILTGVAGLATLAYVYWPWRKKSAPNSTGFTPASLDFQVGQRSGGARATITW